MLVCSSRIVVFAFGGESIRVITAHVGKNVAEVEEKFCLYV